MWLAPEQDEPAVAPMFGTLQPLTIKKEGSTYSDRFFSDMASNFGARKPRALSELLVPFAILVLIVLLDRPSFAQG